jgi:hypothetical protein
VTAAEGFRGELIELRTNKFRNGLQVPETHPKADFRLHSHVLRHEKVATMESDSCMVSNVAIQFDLSPSIYVSCPKVAKMITSSICSIATTCRVLTTELVFTSGALVSIANAP